MCRHFQNFANFDKAYDGHHRHAGWCTSRDGTGGTTRNLVETNQETRWLGLCWRRLLAVLFHQECSAGLTRGLKFNISKKDLMRFKTNNCTPVEINGVAIEEVFEFCQLGSMMSIDGGTAEDIQSRIMEARTAYGSPSNVWNENALSTTTKMRVFSACVQSVLSNGRHVRTDIRKAQVFVNRCVRRTLRIFLNI